MAGLITLEDILEEIVGEIHDEYDEKEDDMFRQISEQEYIIEGSMNLDDINDRLETDLVSEDYDSLGGFIIEHLDRLPEVGDEVCTDNGIRLIVEALDKNGVNLFVCIFQKNMMLTTKANFLPLKAPHRQLSPRKNNTSYTYIEYK